MKWLLSLLLMSALMGLAATPTVVGTLTVDGATMTLQHAQAGYVQGKSIWEVIIFYRPLSLADQELLARWHPLGPMAEEGHIKLAFQGKVGCEMTRDNLRSFGVEGPSEPGDFRHSTGWVGVSNDARDRWWPQFKLTGWSTQGGRLKFSCSFYVHYGDPRGVLGSRRGQLVLDAPYEVWNPGGRRGLERTTEPPR